MESKNPIGVVLSGASTSKATCQLFESAEKGKIQEGIFLQIETLDNKKILARVANIIPQNEFYTPGDAWTEARRKGWDIPEGISRKYELCELELLGEVPRLKKVSIPPYAGDKVFKIDISKAPMEIFGVNYQTPGIIWYGNLIGYQNAPIPLSIEGIPMHLAVFGITGSGKSYDVGALIEKLVKIYAGENTQLSIPMLIIDANGDYLDYFRHYNENGYFGSCPQVTRYIFSNSPEMRMRKPNTKPIAINLNNLTLRDLAELIVQYYSGGEKNELQIAGIEHLFNYMCDKYDIARDDYQSIFLDDEIFLKACQRLDELKRANEIHPATAAAIRRGLNKFREIEKRYKLLSENPKIEKNFVDELTEVRGIGIFDFSADGAPGVPLSLKQLIISYLSTILFDSFTDYKIGGKERYMLFIIE
ncbi:MAG: ATP-binding protein, partial [Candidatus Anstonellales archaeon]